MKMTKTMKWLALVSVAAVGLVCASATKGGDATPAPGTTVAVTNTNVCPKCGMTMDKCTCGKHGKHMKAQTCTNATDKATCTNATVNAVSK